MAETQKTALITGASRGIGRETALQFAAAGYDLFLTCSKTQADLNLLCTELENRFPVRCLAFQTDMGCEAEVLRLFEKIDRLDVLVNNAGISYVGLLSQMTSKDWHRVLSVNLDSCFYTCRAAIPLMLKRQRGRIVNVSSVWGARGASMEVAYSASKGGMNAFTRALAKELAPSNIQVNAVACGVIDTAMNGCLSPEELLALKEEIPADRIGTAAEAARLILQTAEAPAYMTGQIITIDGGWY